MARQEYAIEVLRRAFRSFGFEYGPKPRLLDPRSTVEVAATWSLWDMVRR